MAETGLHPTDQTYVPTSAWDQLWALIWDCTILSILLLPIDALRNSIEPLPIGIEFFLIVLWFAAFFSSKLRASPAMAYFGQVIRSEDGSRAQVPRCLLRGLLIPITIVFSLPLFLLAARNRHKQTLTDWLAGTRVVRRA